MRWALDFTLGFFGAATAEPMREPREVIERLDLGAAARLRRSGPCPKGSASARVLAIGMLTPHPVLLADEPFDGLDLRQTREVGAALRAHAAGGRTIFLSIHQIADAARVCDRFVLLSGGRVCGEGTRRASCADTRVPRPARSRDDLEDIFLALT